MTLSPFRDFRPRFPWWGADLQTMRDTLAGTEVDLRVWPAERLLLPADDGSGDVLMAMHHGSPRASGRPLVVIVHGLTGCEDSVYVRRTAAALLGAGHPVLRLNLRGAGPSRASCRGHYHAGAGGDVLGAVRALPDGLTRDGVVLAGFSLGGAIVVNALAESEGMPVRAGIVVSAPIDLAQTAKRFLAMRNRLYHRWLLARMKAEATAEGASVTGAERAAIGAARTVVAFDDAFIAPRFGFGTAATYYARCSPVRVLKRVPVPLLLLHAYDDPWIPAAPYMTFDWLCNANLTPVITGGGGHVGFHERDGGTWHDATMLAWLGWLGL